MNQSSPLSIPRPVAPVFLGALVITVSLAAGCVTSRSTARPARPGDGLREYQRLVLDLRKEVAKSRQAVETLASATQRNSASAYGRFGDSLQRLEVVSIKARAHADAIGQRGEAYFEEWAEEISGAADEAARRAAKERFAELHGHFEAILNDSRQVRQEFRRFLDGLRELRTKLGESPTSVAVDQAKLAFVHAASDGQQAEGAINRLLTTLKTAEAAVMSGPAPTPKAGGKS